MGEYVSEIWKTVIAGVVLAVSGIGWWVRRQVNRMDNHEDRIHAIEQDYARRSDIKDVIHAIKESEKHTSDRIDRLHERLDDRR